VDDDGWIVEFQKLAKARLKEMMEQNLGPLPSKIVDRLNKLHECERSSPPRSDPPPGTNSGERKMSLSVDQYRRSNIAIASASSSLAF
jgi:hypothetical protein